MRRLFAHLLALVAFSTIAQAGTLKVVSWNIQWLPGGKPDATAEEKATQMAAAQKIVKELNPDILLCQEVADQKAAEELCSVVPGLKVDVISNYHTRPQNMVVASKLPADSAWFGLWKPTLGEDNPPRGYSFAALKLSNGTFLLTYSIHQKSNRGGIPETAKAREESAKQLRSHLSEMMAIYSKRGKCDVVIGGDFNSDPDAKDFKIDRSLSLVRGSDLKWVFSNVPASSRVTIPAKGKYPPANFDHIYYSGLKQVSVEVANGAGVSDHNPVVATFEY